MASQGKGGKRKDPPGHSLVQKSLADFFFRPENKTTGFGLATGRENSLPMAGGAGTTVAGVPELCPLSELAGKSRHVASRVQDQSSGAQPTSSIDNGISCRVPEPDNAGVPVCVDGAAASGKGSCRGKNHEGNESDTENEFEKERQERIHRNKMMLARLGVQDAQAGFAQSLPAAKKQGKSSRPRPCRDAVPIRRSNRSKGKLEGIEDMLAQSVPSEEPRIDAISYDDSTVLRYMCQDSGKTSTQPSAASLDGLRLTGFTAMPHCLRDQNLERAYGMDCQGELLVAGGHRGQVAIWGLRGTEDEVPGEADAHPLLSAKLHSGWICDVQFVAQNSGGEKLPLLLTAANDGIVCLWDCSKTCSGEGRPRKMLEDNEIHSGGIFSMQCWGTSVLTASKDSTVAVSTLRAEGAALELLCRLELHEGVVKCAAWRTGNCIASGGNDRSIHVHDLRMEAAAPSCSPSAMVIANAHGGAVNHVQWNPRDDHMLLSSGLDVALNVFDIRHPANPVHRFCGHSLKAKGIYKPQWADCGSAILSGGDQGLLSLYCCKSNRARSRGELGFNPTAMRLQDSTGRPMLFLARPRAVAIYRPSTASSILPS